MSILRNGNVACLCRLFSSISHLINEYMSHVTTFLAPMLHVTKPYVTLVGFLMLICLFGIVKGM